MEIISENIILDRKNARLILIGKEKAEVIACPYRDLDACLSVLRRMTERDCAVSLDVEDIITLHTPGKTVRLASASAKGENGAEEVFRRAFLNMGKIKSLCFHLTVPQSATLDEIEKGISVLHTFGILDPFAEIIWSMDFFEEEIDEVRLDAIIFE